MRACQRRQHCEVWAAVPLFARNKKKLLEGDNEIYTTFSLSSRQSGDGAGGVEAWWATQKENRGLTSTALMASLRCKSFCSFLPSRRQKLDKAGWSIWLLNLCTLFALCLPSGYICLVLALCCLSFCWESSLPHFELEGQSSSAQLAAACFYWIILQVTNINCFFLLFKILSSVPTPSNAAIRGQGWLEIPEGREIARAFCTFQRSTAFSQKALVCCHSCRWPEQCLQWMI